MNWPFLFFGFCIAIVTGAVAATTLARMRPHWSERRRLLWAALMLPALTLAAAVAAVVAVLASDSGAQMQDLALASIASIAALFASVAFLGGVIGAGLRQRGMRR